MPHQETPRGWLSVTEVINLGLPKVNVSKAGRPYFFLEQWRGKVGNQEADKVSAIGKRIGTEFHEAVETRNWKSEQVKRMYEQFVYQFMTRYNVEIITTEQTYIDEKLKLQGTNDAEIKCSKFERGIADWKTSNSLDLKGGPLQLAAYDYLTKGSGNGVLVRVDKETDKVEIEWFNNLKEYWPIFKACYKVAKYQKFGLKGNK